MYFLVAERMDSLFLGLYRANVRDSTLVEHLDMD